MSLEDTIGAVVNARARGVTIKFGYQRPWGLEARIIDRPRLDGLNVVGWDLHRRDFRTFNLRKMQGTVLGPSIEELHEHGAPTAPEVIGDAHGTGTPAGEGGGETEPGGPADDLRGSGG